MARSSRLRCVSPVDGRVYVERPLASQSEVERVLAAARRIQTDWRRRPLADRQRITAHAVDLLVARRDAIADEITWQMGRPLSQSPGELRGFEERARHMIAIAPEALADLGTPLRAGFTRFIRREPVGVVFVIAPWNYPYLTAVNSVVPALLAGNAVLLKHSSQTPLCSERFAEAFAEAGLPDGLFHALHLSHDDTLALVASPGIDHVVFTGSVPGGHAIQQAAAARFIGTGLELGGKDPAYVRADADLGQAVEGLVDGAFFNSGQSCCGIERIYVHASLFDDFIGAAADLTRRYHLGNPLQSATTLGPMVRAAAADFVRGQIREAISAGARALIAPADFPADEPGSPYLAPQILVDVDHRMRVMHEESFGPVVGVMRVEGDDEAIALMNDSDFGLTASLWTRDLSRALELGDRLETGTVFMNRCDYLDPALAWTGVKDSGLGCALSALGFDSLTRPKSFHLRQPLPG
jgi:acyl-CoA reductase-like NAD-dependent aldehyde dehydrogenase